MPERPLRTLRLIHSVNPAGGGPIESVKQVSRAIESLGHAVEVASLDLPDDPWVKDFPLTLHALGTRRSHYGYSPALLPWLKAHRRKYDAVIVSGLWQYHSFATWRALRGTETPYVVFPHGMLDPWFKRTYPLKHLKKWLYWPWAEYRVLRDAAAILFTSEEERRLARESFWLYRCRERTVCYGTAAPPDEPERQKAAFFERFPWLRGRRLVLFLGRLHEKKGCDLLIEAFCRLQAREPLHLVLAGPCAGPAYLANLQSIAARRSAADAVTWAGALWDEVKWGAFRASEVFVLPSHQENFGIAVAEALACALPVLITNKVNIWREIADDGAGLVESDDLPGVSRLLERWAAMGEPERETMRSAAERCFMGRFEIQRAAERLVEVLGAVAYS